MITLSTLLFIIAALIALVFAIVRRTPWDYYICILLICAGLLIGSFIKV